MLGKDSGWNKGIPYRLEEPSNHTLVGVMILAIAVYAPVSPLPQDGFVGCVVSFNVVRMKYLD